MQNTSEVWRTLMSSALIVCVRVGGTALTFAYTLLMARTMSPDDVGVAWAIWSSTFVFSVFTTLNIGGGSIREIVHARVHGELDMAAGFIRVSRLILLACSPLVMAIFLLFSWQKQPDIFWGHLDAFVVGALSLPILGWVQSNATQAAALHKALASQAPRELVRPFLFLAAFGFALFISYRPSVAFVINTYFVAIVITAILQYMMLRRSFGFLKGVQPNMKAWKRWLVTGLLLSPSRVIGENLKNIFILAAAMGLAEADTAKIAIALSLIGFLNFGISAVDMTFSPKISTAIVARQAHRRDTLLAASSVTKLLPIAVVAFVIIYWAGDFLGLFGHSYISAAPVISWLILLPLSNAATGPADLVLQINGRYRTVFAIALSGIIGLLLMVPFFGYAYGLEAAAAAGAITYCIMQLTMCTACNLQTGIDTSVLGALRVSYRRLAAAR